MDSTKDLYKSKGKKIDAVCDGGKKNTIAYVEGSVDDCADRCDKTLHPTKCTGFTHYNLPDGHKSGRTATNSCTIGTKKDGPQTYGPKDPNCAKTIRGWGSYSKGSNWDGYSGG